MSSIIDRFVLKQQPESLVVNTRSHEGRLPKFLLSRRPSGFTDQQVVDVEHLMQSAYEVGRRDGANTMREDLKSLMGPE